MLNSNDQQPTTSKDDHYLNPNKNLFYRNAQPYSSSSLKSTFSDTNREPIDYDKLQDRYRTNPDKKIERPGTVDKLVRKVRSNLICCPTSKDESDHRKSLSAIEVNINETRSEITLSKINKDDEIKSNNNCCNSSKLINTVISLFPIVEALQNYDLKNDLIKEIFAGITIAVLHIPQGMAYGLLAGVEPINGLYVSFFPVLIYGFLGTSRHVSVGTFAVVSLMLYNAANKLGAIKSANDEVTTLSPNLTSIFPTASEISLNNHSNRPLTAIEVQTSLSLLIGLIMIVMGVLNLGVLSLVLSDQLITSFSSGAAIHVATSQLGSALGIHAGQFNGSFKIVFTWLDLIKHYDQISYSTLIISVSVLFTLIIFKEFLEIPIRKKLKIDFQIPIDLLVIIISTIISSHLDLGNVNQVRIMGPIPTGIPPPSLPRTDLFPRLIYDAIAITMVIFALLISLSKLYANKFNYKISPNHELIALGSANLVGSFFLCFPASASLSRSSVQERTGAKTQLVGIISSFIVLMIVLYLAPLFFHLPKCVLACIILVALKGLFLQIGEIRRIWKISRSEGLVWFVTFTSTVLLDVDYGLVIGVIFSLMMTLLQFTMPSSTLLGQVPFTEIYVDSEIYSKAIQLKGIRIFQFSCPLFFLNCDYFKEQLFTKTLHMPFGELLKKSNLNESQSNENESNNLDQNNMNKRNRFNLKLNDEPDYDQTFSNTNLAYLDDNQQTIISNQLSTTSSNRPTFLSNEHSITSANQLKFNTNVLTGSSSTNHIFQSIYEADCGNETTVHTIIIDCSGISTIDSAGVKCLSDVINDFSKIKLHCYLASCTSPLLLMFQRMKFIEKLPSNAKVFATIHDAVLNAFNRTHQLPHFIMNHETISQLSNGRIDQ